MSNQVYSFIKQELHEAKFFTVLADETKDISKCEQLSIAFQYVHHSKTIERFVGYSLASDLSARSLANYITAKMTNLQLNPDHLVSQCYVWFQCRCSQIHKGEKSTGSLCSLLCSPIELGVGGCCQEY